MFKKMKSEGVSLKVAHIIMIIATIIVMVLLIFELFRTYSVYSEMNKATDNYITLHNSAESLMDASDFLTDRAQRFTISLEEADMNEYFGEVHGTRRRDIALEQMEKISGDSDAFEQLKNAMERSKALEKLENYSMRLICEAVGIKNPPPEVADVVLDEVESEMSAEDKIKRAQVLVHDDEYYRQKMSIRESMENCTKVLIEDTDKKHTELNGKLRTMLSVIGVLIVVQSLSMVMVLWMTSYLGINPIIKGVQKIKENNKIPIVGSSEFRYLAKTYNRMYEAFQKSIEKLNFEASHDKLTGVYNRAGYDVIKEGIDLRSTAVLVVDADEFKGINDGHGHTVGDKVLRKIADVLKKTFRHGDYICRIGGDEFAVFMVHMEKDSEDLIRLKVNLINKKLKNTDDGLPPVTVSIGIAYGMNEDDIDETVKHADEALYKMKKSTKCGCKFYSA